MLWLKSLKTVFHEDDEAAHELQKTFGYFLTLDTSLQKIFAIVGPKRGGKGTIASVLRGLIGKRNVCAPSINMIGNDFGLESFIGKQLAIFPDARIGTKTDKSKVAERLLSFSGEDALDVARENKIDWHGKLDARLLIVSDELPPIGDSSGALALRYAIFSHKHSFFGCEDHQLSSKLQAKLPGILNWALEGLRYLKVERIIRTPSSGAALAEELERISSPIKAFVDDQCEWGEGCTVEKDALWQAYRMWHCQEGLHGNPLSKEYFGRRLKTAFAGQIQETRLRLEDDRRTWVWAGVRLAGNSPTAAATPHIRHGPGLVQAKVRAETRATYGLLREVQDSVHVGLLFPIRISQGTTVAGAAMR